MDAQWLTAALRDSGVIGPAARVATVEARRIALETGFSSELYRLRLTGDDGVPASVVVKMPTGTAVREAMDLVGGYRREVTFYEQVAGRAPLGTPRVYAARMAQESSDFVLVLEDLGDWDNADHLAGLSVDAPGAASRSSPDLHAWSERPANADLVRAFPSLDGPVVRPGVSRSCSPRAGRSTASRRARPSRRRWPATPSASASTPRPRSARSPSARCWSTVTSAPTTCSSATGRLTVVDFQLASLAAGPVDIGYLVSRA